MINITLKPDMTVEPGHQIIVLPNDDAGCSLARLLTGLSSIWFLNEKDFTIQIPHTADVDQRIVELIDALAHVRYQAPDLIQMTLQEMPE